VIHIPEASWNKDFKKVVTSVFQEALWHIDAIHAVWFGYRQ